MNANASDSALLHAWQRHRDAEAFHALVRRHAQLVFNTCRHIVRNDTDAADVAQECFLSLATTPPEIERSLAGWLHRLATHRALNHLKQQRRRRNREISYAQEMPGLAHKETDDLLSLIDEAIDTLPDELRVPLVDHFFRQKSHQEVATELGIPRRTVSYRINSGIEQLRAALNNRGVVAPVAGLAELLEWQRAEAVTLPEGLYAKLCKYAIAGASSDGPRQQQPIAYTSAGMSGVVLLLLCSFAILCVAGWFAMGGRGPWTRATATVEDENLKLAEDAGVPVDAVSTNTTNNTKIERAAAGVAQAEVAGGKVTGRVYDADTDAPIPGAVVKIALLSDTYTPVATCTTDAEGYYATEALPLGEYMIYRGETPGYGATSEKIDKAGTRLPKPEMDGIRFELTKDNIIDLPVHKGLFISGVVVDGLGNGIPKATVSARARFQNNGQTVQTASDGTFYLAGFSSTYDLSMSVKKSGFGRQNYSRLNIGFPGLENLRITLPIASRISGKVIQSDGSPVGNAHVMAFHDLEAKRWPLDFPDAHTDSDGNYSIKGLGPGDYAVQVFSGGYRHISVAQTAVFVNLAAGDNLENVDIRVTAQPGFTVSGTVTEPDGTPISNQVVTLGTAFRTDADGRFTVSGLPGGQYLVESEVDAFRTGFEYARTDVSADDETNRKKMGFIAIDRDRDDLHVVLYRNTFTLSGHVLDAASGEPMKYFEICTFPGHGTVPHSTESWHEAQRVVSEDGSFRLQNLPLEAGPWSVVVRVPGFGTGTTDLSISADMTEAEVMLPVIEGTSVVGTVVDHNRRPVEGAEIIFGPPFESRVAVTAIDGSFRATGLPSGTKINKDQLSLYRDLGTGKLTAFHPDYTPVSVPIPEGGDKSPILFQFEPAGAVEVSLTRAGKPVSMANISIGRSEIAQTPCIGLGSKSVSGDGTATFSGVSPGPCDIRIQTRLGNNAPLSIQRTIEVVPGKATPLHVDLGGPVGSINGTFLFDGSPPIEGISVTFTSITGVDPISVDSDVDRSDGTWRLDEIPAGSGTLTFKTYVNSMNMERSMTLDLKPGEAATIDINHGGVGDEAEESTNLRGNIRLEGTWPEDAYIVVGMVTGETSLTYSRMFSIRHYAATLEGEWVTLGAEPVADEPIEWVLEGIAAGSSTLTIRASDADGARYERVMDLTLSPDEEQNLDITLTGEDLVELPR